MRHTSVKDTREPFEDVAAVTSFLAMAVKQQLMLNGRTAREAWDAMTRMMGLAPATSSELLCRMLDDDPDA
jgi:hypothetical protein